MASGGYQRPANPAPVSGPGALARRTDGVQGEQTVAELPDAQYGEAAAFRESQQQAPLAASQPATPTVPFGAPTQKPGEPVTSGIDLGAGPGSEAMVQARTGASRQVISEALSKLASVSSSDGVVTLLMEAQRRGL